MTLASAIARVRRLTRTTSSGKTDAEVCDTINEGQWQFAEDVHGLTKEGYLTLAPRFDTQTNFAIRLTITGGGDAMAATDVAITTTARENTTGTIVASDLQATIRTATGTANPTVTWSTTTWKFTLSTVAGTTSITIDEPSGITYVDACSMLGLDTGTTTGVTITDNIPTDCTVETALPSDYLQIVPPVEWDGRPLTAAPFDIFASPGSSGTPRYWGIRNKLIRVYPYPTSQKLFHIWYKYLPTEFTAGYQECGLTGMTDATATGLAATTAYYFKVTANGGTQTEFSITTGATATFAQVITLINAAITTGVTSDLVGGDLRFTSDSVGEDSAVALAAGTTGTDLFATLTGWTAFDTAVGDSGGADINLESEDAMAAVYYAAFCIADENFEEKVADRNYAKFKRMVSAHIVRHANANPKMFPKAPPFVSYTVDL